MTSVVGGVVAVVLAALAALHVHWAVGGRWGAAAALPQNPDATAPAFRPPAALTLLVAAALLFAAAMVLVASGVVPAAGGLHRVARVVTLGLATVFALRVVGDFRYVGLFKRVRGTPFATWDGRVHVPLCAALAGACAFVAL